MKPKEGYGMMKKLLKKGTYVVLGILCCMFIWMQLGTESFAFTRTTGEVTGSSVKVRKEAGTNSDVIASVKAGNKVDVTDAVDGADGKVWYKVMISANEYGYIRSDFVSLEGGAQTPSNSTTETPSANTTPAEITPMDKQNAHVNTDNVKVRQSATTSSTALDKLSPEDNIIVTGSTKGADGKVWYQVSYSDNGTEKGGFIRSDLVTLTGPVEIEEPEDEPVEEEPKEEPKPEVPAPSVNYEAVYTTDEKGEYIWYLYDRTLGQRYKIDQLLKVSSKDKEQLEELSDANFTLKIWLIVVVCLFVMGAVFVAFLFIKVREDEEDTPRPRRNMNMAQTRVQRPVVNRETVRTPERRESQPVRPSQPSKPAQPVKTVQQTRPQVNQGPGVKTVAESVKPSQVEARPQAAKQKTSWIAKNFLEDNDEFEFGFLDFDDEE